MGDQTLGLGEACRAFGVDRLAESVPGAAVGWRSSFVLFSGSRAGAPIVSESAGNGLSNRVGAGADVDGFRHL